jgi:hypothetical protein
MKRAAIRVTLHLSLILLLTAYSCSNEYRHAQLKQEFAESEFNGVVTAIARDKPNHNALKIFYGTNDELDVTWFSNQYELIGMIKVGDFLVKEKGKDYLTVQSDSGIRKITVTFIR